MPFDRKPAAELLDDDLGTPEEIAGALQSISFVNRWFGGNRVHRLLFEQILQGRSHLDVLEIAAGRAVPLAAASLAFQRRGITLNTTLLDLNRSHLPTAWPPSLPSPRLIQGNALAIPLPDKSVDVVSSCLFLHHLAPEQAAAVLRESIRVARVAVLVNDLNRTRIHYALARLFSNVDRSRLSAYDGPVSVRQAHSYAELRTMLQATGCRFTLRRRFLYRLAALLWTR